MSITDEPGGDTVTKCRCCGSEDIPRTVPETTVRLEKVEKEAHDLLALVAAGATRAETCDEFNRIVVEYYHCILGIEVCGWDNVSEKDRYAAEEQDCFISSYCELYNTRTDAEESDVQRNAELQEKIKCTRKVLKRMPPKKKEDNVEQTTKKKKDPKSFYGKGALREVSLCWE